MGSIKWIELGKLAIGVVLAGLIIVVSNLLLQSTEQANALDRQAAIVREFASSNSVPDPVHRQSGLLRYDLYQLKTGESVVFLPCAVDARVIELAVSLDRNNAVRDCRIVSFAMPPQSLFLEALAAEVHLGKLKGNNPDFSALEQDGIFMSAQNQRQALAFCASLSRASEISRTGGKL